MERDDQKLKDFLDKHDTTPEFANHPSEWARLQQEIESQPTRWWQRRPVFAVLSMALVVAVLYTFTLRIQPSGPFTAAPEDPSTTYLLEAYDIVDNGFETSVDDYYSLLN